MFENGLRRAQAGYLKDFTIHDNLSAFRDTFRQGILEQRMFLEAIRTLKVPPTTFASCTGIDLGGEANAFFDEAKLIAMGQSMGGAYTNYLSALEPRVKIAVPTGAGGYWTHFFFYTPLQNGAFPGLFRPPRPSRGPPRHPARER